MMAALGDDSLANVTLTTERLVLRELEAGDVDAVQVWATDPEVLRYTLFGPNSLDDSRAFLARAAASRAARPRRAFEVGIVRRSDGTLLGATGLRVQSVEHRDGDLGYTLRRDAWGQGYATESTAALIAFGRDVLGLHRIWATCHVDNVASARVLEKVGMQREGRLRHKYLQRGVWRDSYLYAYIDERVSAT